MIGITNLEVYNSFFDITEENNNFELYTNIFDEFSSEELDDELEDIPIISDITPSLLQHVLIGVRIIPKYRKLISEKSNTNGYINLLWVMLDLVFEILKIILGL